MNHVFWLALVALFAMWTAIFILHRWALRRLDGHYRVVFGLMNFEYAVALEAMFQNHRELWRTRERMAELLRLNLAYKPGSGRRMRKRRAA